MQSTDSQPQVATVAEFNNVHVAGCFSLMKARVFGSFACKYAKIDGDFCLDESFVAGSMFLRGSRFAEVRTDKKTDSSLDQANGNRTLSPSAFMGDIDLTCAKVGGDVRLIGVAIGGDLKLQTARIRGGILCRSASNLKKSVHCEIGGKAWLLGVETGADVDFSGTHIWGDLTIQNARVGQNVWAISRGGSRSWINGNVSLVGGHISGSSIFNGVYCGGDMQFDGASIGRDLVVALDIDAVRHLEIVTARVSGRITAEAAKIGRNVVLMGLEVGKHCAGDAAKVDTEIPSATFVGAQINGEVTLYREAYIDDMLDMPHSDSEKIQISTEAKEAARKKAVRARSIISGSLNLARSHVLGVVVLDGAQIEGTLDFENAELRANLRCCPIDFGPIDHGSREIVSASVHRANFEMVTVAGDMDLTGLNIRHTPGLRGSGDLNLRNSTIQGRLELYPQDRTEDVKPAGSIDGVTVIDGKLWLDGANIGYVIISGRSFANFAQNEHKDEPRTRPSVVTRWLGGGHIEAPVRARVRFERAKFGRLQIIDPLPDTADLSNLEVARWDLPKQGLRDNWPELYAAMTLAAHWVMWPLLLASASGIIRKRS